MHTHKAPRVAVLMSDPVADPEGGGGGHRGQLPPPLDLGSKRL